MVKFLILIFGLLASSASAIDQYSVIELPEGFTVGSTRPLNARGQVAGVVNEKVATWDRYRGLSLIPVDGKSGAGGLNDNGLICVCLQKQGKIALVWDTNNDEVFYGPTGTPYAINNLNDVLIYSGYSNDMWNATTDFFASSIGSVKSINNKGAFVQECLGNNIYAISINDKGNVLARRNGDVFFSSNGELYNVSLPIERIGFGVLNNFDEIITLVFVDNSKTKRAICKWKKGRNITISESLEELQDLKDSVVLELLATNDLGQILISSVKKNSLNTKKCFLLTPKK